MGRATINVPTVIVAACVGIALLACSAAAHADPWLPHPAGATWRYEWTDSVYNPSGTIENVDVQYQSGNNFMLAWADSDDLIPAAGESLSVACLSSTEGDIGTVSLSDSNVGPINSSWGFCGQPSGDAILCATADGCDNGLSSALLDVIWGDRSPVIYEPLLQGRSWTATGGATNDVSSSSTVLGQQRVKVPAFPNGVMAAVVRTQIIQTDAIDSGYGSGIRTTWWVDGVGPVKVIFDHAGGEMDPYGLPAVTSVELLSTNRVPQQPPPDANYFPLQQGTHTFEWTNTKHLQQPEIESITVDPLEESNVVSWNEAVASVKSVSGPMRVSGEYVFSLGLNGLTNLLGDSEASTLVRFPSLGHGRHFLTPLDLMVYGFNPILPAYGQPGEHWKSGNPADFNVFGVTGSTAVIGTAKVRVPAGSFTALVVRSVLTQRGHPFGSGIRTSYFAAGRGLVKLVFQHRDGSTSVIELLK